MSIQTQTSRIRKIDVGTPPSSLSLSNDNEWESIEVHYHDFENLTTTRDEAVVSSEFTCFGHKWRLKLYPGGNTTLVEDGMVSIALHNQSDRSITVQYGYSIKHKGRKVKCDFLSKDEGSEFAARGTRDANNQIFDGWVRPNFWKRSQII